MVASEPHHLLADAERRAERVWYEDGLPEIGVGLLWLLLGAIQFGDGAPWWVAPFWVVPLFGGIWLVNRLVVRAKRRLVDPHVGLVRPRDYGLQFFRRYWFPSAVVAAAIGLVDGVGRAAVPGWRFLGDWWPFLILATVLAVGGARQRDPAAAGLALIPLAFAALSVAGVLAAEAVFGWCLLALGAATLLLGAWRLRRFLNGPGRAPDASVPA